jgi:hypothetical protein
MCGCDRSHGASATQGALPPGACARRAPACDQQNAADREADGNETREDCGPELLARNRAEALNVNQHSRAERDQQHAPDGVIELHADSALVIARTTHRRGPRAADRGSNASRHFTMPTAFIVAPRSASDFAMNFCEVVGRGVDDAEPCFAMKSL